MSEQLGADVAQLENLARKFNEEGDKIRTAVSAISGQVDQVWWKGKDADRFRSEWQGAHRSTLQKVADSLSTASTHCKNQADQQRQISGG